MLTIALRNAMVSQIVRAARMEHGKLSGLSGLSELMDRSHGHVDLMNRTRASRRVREGEGEGGRI
jgi:hypothetical protein